MAYLYPLYIYLGTHVVGEGVLTNNLMVKQIPLPENLADRRHQRQPQRLHALAHHSMCNRQFCVAQPTI